MNEKKRERKPRKSKETSCLDVAVDPPFGSSLFFSHPLPCGFYRLMKPGDPRGILKQSGHVSCSVWIVKLATDQLGS